MARHTLQYHRSGLRLAYRTAIAWLGVVIATLHFSVLTAARADSSAPLVKAQVQHGALLWYRTSSEMQALYRQAYQIATDRLPTLGAGHAEGSWVVVMDADETILNNSEWRLRRVIPDPAHPASSWNDWVREERATALPGAKDFIDHVYATGGRVVVVTNRDDSVCGPTQKNLQKLEIKFDGVICATDNTGDKNPRFESIRAGTSLLKLPALAIVAFVGDNIQDFPGKKQGNAGSLDEFGRSLFMVPNPTYGSWEHNVLH